MCLGARATPADRIAPTKSRSQTKDKLRGGTQAEKNETQARINALTREHRDQTNVAARTSRIRKEPGLAFNLLRKHTRAVYGE